MRRRRIITAALGAVLAACAGDPEDPFFFFGRAQHGNGQAVAGAQVQLFRVHERFCWTRLFEVPSQILEQVDQAATDERGRFLFQLFRYELETRDEAARDSCFRADLEEGPTGAKTWVWATMGAHDVDVDRVYRWDAGAISVAATAEGQLLSAPAGPLPRSGTADWESNDVVAYEWELTASGFPLWRAESTEAPLTLDGALREDFAEIEARIMMLGLFHPPDEPSLFGAAGWNLQTATLPPVSVPAFGSRVPISRGAPCAVDSRRFDPCSATDGRLELPFLGFLATSGHAHLVFELRTAARPSLAIFRGLETTELPRIAVEGSPDGATWSPLGSVELSAPEPRQEAPVSAYEALTRFTSFGGRVRSGFYRLELTPPAEPITHIRLLGNGSFHLREASFFE